MVYVLGLRVHSLCSHHSGQIDITNKGECGEEGDPDESQPVDKNGQIEIHLNCEVARARFNANGVQSVWDGS